MIAKKYQKLLLAWSILSLLWGLTTFKLAQDFKVSFIIFSVFTIPFFTLMIGWLFWYKLQPTLVTRVWFKYLANLGSFCLGWWATFMLLAIPIDGILLLTKWLTFYQVTIHLQTIDLYLITVALLLTFIGLGQAYFGPRVKTVKINIPKLTQDLHNLRIAQISDLHLGISIGVKTIAQVVSLTNALQPDLIFITGDLIDADVDLLDLELLTQLKARYGIYYVTGNHEYYWQATKIIAKTQSFGWTVLLNTNRVLTIKQTKILIAGITDQVGDQFITGHTPNLPLALESAIPTTFKILLAHRPEVYTEAASLGVNLQCSGHTHGGQFFPFNLIMPFFHRYYRALHRHGNSYLYVNVGTGYWGPANRLGVPAEITLLTLTTK